MSDPVTSPMRDPTTLDELPTRYTPDVGTVQVCPTCQGDGRFVAFDGFCPAAWAHRYLNALPTPAPSGQAGASYEQALDDAWEVAGPILHPEYYTLASFKAAVRKYAAPSAVPPDVEARAILDRAIDKAISTAYEESADSYHGILRRDITVALDALLALSSRVPGAGQTRAGEATADAPITDAERIEAIAITVSATTDGVVIHDATSDWSVVVLNDGEIYGRGEDVRGALDQMVLQDRMVRKVLQEHRVPPSPTTSAE